MSWIHRDDGYRLFCNRDEKRTRAVAAPPQIHAAAGTRFVAPKDGDRGGTWIAVNEFGVSLCLLNGSGGGTGRESRGHVVARLVGTRTSMEAMEMTSRMDLAAHAPFLLAILEPGMPTALAEWNGDEVSYLPDGDSLMPLVSSSFEPDAIRERRRCTATRLANDLSRFHRSHDPAPSAYSTCMHRPDAETVSLSQIHVGRESARFLYTPGSPCRRAPAIITRLGLRR